MTTITQFLTANNLQNAYVMTGTAATDTIGKQTIKGHFYNVRSAF